MQKIIPFILVGITVLIFAEVSLCGELKLTSHPYAHDQELYEEKKHEASTKAMQHILDKKGGIRAEESLTYIDCYLNGMSMNGFSEPDDIIWQFHLIYTHERKVTGVIFVNETQDKVKIHGFRSTE